MQTHLRPNKINAMIPITIPIKVILPGLVSVVFIEIGVGVKGILVWVAVSVIAGGAFQYSQEMQL